MAYKVLNDFVEKGHENVLYQKGETYPREGFEANEERIAFLQKKHEDYKVAFLGEEVKEESETPAKNTKSTAASKSTKTETTKTPTEKKDGDDK